MRQVCAGGIETLFHVARKPGAGRQVDEVALAEYKKIEEDQPPPGMDAIIHAFKSKITGLVQCIKELREKEPETKIVIFSCYQGPCW